MRTVSLRSTAIILSLRMLSACDDDATYDAGIAYDAATAYDAASASVTDAGALDDEALRRQLCREPVCMPGERVRWRPGDPEPMFERCLGRTCIDDDRPRDPLCIDPGRWEANWCFERDVRGEAMIVEATPDWHYAVRAPFSLRVLGSTFAFDGHVNLSGPVMEVDFPTAGRYRVRVDVARFEAAMLDDQDGCEITANFSDSSGNWQQVDARYEQEVAVEHPARLSMRVGGSCRRGLPADQLISINVVIDEPTPL